MGKRVGYKRSDRRWKDDNGIVWASKFEWTVYDTLRRSGVHVRKCDSGDTYSYTEPKPNVKCMACGSCECVQERTYTPDLYIIPQSAKPNSGGYYLEVKGYFRPEKRALFRCLRKSRADVDLRVVLETDGWATKGKTRLSQYFASYLKTTPCHVWDGNIPGDWQ